MSATCPQGRAKLSDSGITEACRKANTRAREGGGFARSRVSNRSHILPGVDGRSTWVRRLRDLVNLHTADLGGEAVTSEAERSIIRRAATLTVELERLELKFATAGEADSIDLELYQRTANSLRRMLETIGIKRVPRDITPPLRDYLARTATQAKEPVE
jgi:hypothetical protein